MKQYLVLYKYTCIHCTRIHEMGARTPGSLFIESWGVNYISSSALLLYLNLSNLNLIIRHFIFKFVCLNIYFIIIKFNQVNSVQILVKSSVKIIKMHFFYIVYCYPTYLITQYSNIQVSDYSNCAATSTCQHQSQIRVQTAAINYKPWG